MQDDKNEKRKRNKDKHLDDDIKKDLDNILDQLSESETNEPRETRKMDEKNEKPREELPQDPASEKEELEGIMEQISEKEDGPAENLNFLQRVVYVFTNPTRLFQYLSRKPDFILPLLLAMAISIVVSYSVFDIALDTQISKVEKSDRYNDQQKNQILDRIEASRHGTMRAVYTYVTPPVAVGVIFGIAALIFLFVGNIILGGKTNYARVFSVYTYAMLIDSIAGSVVKVPIWVSQHSMQFNTSLAVFLPTSQSGTVLFKFLNSMDIFTIWALAVFGIGFAVIYRFTQLKGILSVFITWLLYVLIFKVAISSLFGSLGA